MMISRQWKLLTQIQVEEDMIEEEEDMIEEEEDI